MFKSNIGLGSKDHDIRLNMYVDVVYILILIVSVAVAVFIIGFLKSNCVTTLYT